MTRSPILLLLLYAIIGGAMLPAGAQQTQAPVVPQSQVPGAPPQVAMIMLQVEHNKGKEYIITPRGLKAQVPGKGISSGAKAVAVYQDPQQNYWYIDKHGEPTPGRPEVVQSVMAQFQAQIQQNQAAPMAANSGGIGGAPVQQTTIIQQPPAGYSGGSGAGAMAGPLAAMSGAAMGMSIGALANSSKSYYGVPYGQPLYHDYHHPYYYNNSKKVYVNPNVNNKAYFDQWNKQGNWNNRSTWEKNLQTATPSTAQRVNRATRRGLLSLNPFPTMLIRRSFFYDLQVAISVRFEWTEA